MVNKCKYCGNNTKTDKAQFCSMFCYRLFLKTTEGRLMQGKRTKGKQFSEEHKQKIKIALKNHIKTEEHKAKIMAKCSGKAHWNWKGNDVDYITIHQWVRRNKPKSDICEKCGKRDVLELSCNNHVYTKNINDYEWLCLKCHHKKDKKSHPRCNKTGRLIKAN